MNQQAFDDRGVLEALVGDGRPLLLFSGLALVLSGVFAFFLAASGQFLPHDIAFLGMQPEELCAINECRIVHFMIHDRVSFGGSIFAIGALYMWLAAFPLRAREVWSWWVFVLSGVTGFGSFMAYLGYGYLDTWHGAATLFLLPCFIVGVARSYFTLSEPRGPHVLLHSSVGLNFKSQAGLGRICLLAACVGLITGGITIMLVGMTTVFVPQDLAYIGLNAEDVAAINPRLVPLIAHDRAGFGGGVCTCGVVMFFCIWCGTPSRNLWQVLFVSGFAGFATAIGIHPVIGYNDVVHLAPAVFGAALYATGLALSYKSMHHGSA